MFAGGSSECIRHRRSIICAVAWAWGSAIVTSKLSPFARHIIGLEDTDLLSMPDKPRLRAASARKKFCWTLPTGGSVNRILGIDPGLSGAYAVVENGIPVYAADMPVHDDPRGKGKVIDIYEVRKDFEELLVDKIVIEKVASRPTDGGASAFTFGRTVGMLEAIAHMMAVPIQYVTPAVWKRKRGLIKKEKDASRQLALLEWPDFRHHLRLKKHHGRADAIWIALHGASS